MPYFRWKCFRALVIIIVLSGASCTSRKNLVYFNSDSPGASSQVSASYTPVLKTDDFLSITVMGLEPEAVKPFNLPVPPVTNMNNGYIQGVPSLYGYLIDADGFIDFPVLGRIKLAGLDRMTATQVLKEKLREYIGDPIVHIRIQNFKVTVLGEVRNPGTFTIPNERITLPEALGLAGDLNITGVRRGVLVIRDNDGKKTETYIDLTTKELYTSPVYYLQQNDVIYVAPNRARVNSSAINSSNVGIAISVISLIVTSVAVSLTLLAR